jgi:hypothetical protein
VTAPPDLAAIRARHAEAERLRGLANTIFGDPLPHIRAQAAHADRGALLAYINGLASATERRDPPVPGSSANVLPVRLHQVGPEAALDRLAAITPDEIAQAIAETRGPSPSGVETIWHGLPWGETSAANQVTYRAMAAAVVALLHARREGP